MSFSLKAHLSKYLSNVTQLVSPQATRHVSQLSTALSTRKLSYSGKAHYFLLYFILSSRRNRRNKTEKNIKHQTCNVKHTYPHSHIHIKKEKSSRESRRVVATRRSPATIDSFYFKVPPNACTLTAPV